MKDKYTFKLNPDNIYTLYFDEINPIYHVSKWDLSDMILDDIIILVNNAYDKGVQDCASEMTVKAVFEAKTDKFGEKKNDINDHNS